MSDPSEGKPQAARPGSAVRAPLDAVVQQHADEAAQLRHQRSVAVRAPHVGLALLARLDQRLEAHLDGLLVAGPAGDAAALRVLAEGSAGAAFGAAVQALRQRDEPTLDRLLALAAEQADAARGLVSAFGWVSANTLQGVVRRLLSASDPQTRALGIDACRMHRVDPGPVLTSALSAAQPGLRAAALRAAGALGRVDLAPAVLAALGDSEPELVFLAAAAACRLGEQRASLQVLMAVAQQPGADAAHAMHEALATHAAHATNATNASHAGQAMQLLLASCPPAQAQEFARQLSAAAQTQPTLASRRRLLQAMALLGDARHLPWLIERMHEPTLARLAGEAFSWITGADLAALQLEQIDLPPAPPDAMDSPDNTQIALDDDDNLPWPDVPRLQSWWERQAASTPQAASLFMGHSCSDTGALTRVLVNGTQRQRQHAALLLGLRQPAEPLFATAAPAWRQQRWLRSLTPHAAA